MPDRFSLPPTLGPATPVRFPAIAREVLANGLRVWSIPLASLPLVTLAIVLERGAIDDPPTLPGLAGLTGDLVDEGAGGRDAIELAEALARLGTELDVNVGSDATVFSATVLARFFEPALALVADVMARPHLAEPDLRRVRELRVNRLRQLRNTPGPIADRAFHGAVFQDHPYGRGVLGTTRALQAATLDDVRAFHARTFQPAAATLVVSGDVAPSAAVSAARRWLESWTGVGQTAPARPVPPAPPTAAPPVLLVHRPGAPQSELRVGHLGPSRATPAYHQLVTLNAVLGGQFSSRINQNLRESKGVTYGASTNFEFRRALGAFVCETSVHTDATAQAAAEILAECSAVRSDRPVQGDELLRAKNSLTRGYVRNFETSEQIVRAAAQLVAYGLPDDTFDRFVPKIMAVGEGDVLKAAGEFVRPDQSVVVVVGDADRCRGALPSLGRTVSDVEPEF